LLLIAPVDHRDLPPTETLSSELIVRALSSVG